MMQMHLIDLIVAFSPLVAPDAGMNVIHTRLTESLQCRIQR